MASLILASAFFVGIHVFIAGSRLREVLVARLGEPGFRGLFSLLSALGLAWLVCAYSHAPYIELWGHVAALKPVALVVVLVAFLFLGVGLTTPNPTSVGGEAQLDQDEPAHGMLRITRHPFLWGVALWAFTHLIVNGDAAAVVLFGSLLVLALAGPPSIDAKRRRRFGDRWERFAGVTSNVPFAAISQGRNSLRLGEIKLWQVGVALLLYAVLVATHGWLFGVSALPG